MTRVLFPQDWFGTLIWPPFHCLGTPIWLPQRHVKTLYIFRYVLVGQKHSTEWRTGKFATIHEYQRHVPLSMSGLS